MNNGLKMKLRRVELGKTQAQLRKETKASLNTIVALEKGNIAGVRVNTLKKIAKALDMTVAELFFSEEE